MAAIRATLTAVTLLACVAGAEAQTASAWEAGISSHARLLAGQVPEAGGPSLFAGVEIRLEEGWKTYWRNPGDAGIPPTFDWTGSSNLAAAEALYPAPHRFADPAGQSIGYKNSVVFPVRLSPADPGAPIQLRLKLSYAACATLCVPAEANLALTVPPALQMPAGAIAEALGRVPRKPVGDNDMPRVEALSVEGEGAKRRMSITVVQPPGAEETDLFIEGPSSWYLPLAEIRAKREAGAATEIVYEVPLDELPKSARLTGQTLRLTLVSAADAVEQEWTLP